MTIRGGELVGIGLADLLRRRDARDDATPVVWQGGRTPFDQASLQMAIVDGVATISEAKLSGNGVRAALQGRTSLAHRTVAAKASVEATLAFSWRAIPDHPRHHGAVEQADRRSRRAVPCSERRRGRSGCGAVTGTLPVRPEIARTTPQETGWALLTTLAARGACRSMMPNSAHRFSEEHHARLLRIDHDQAF